VEYKEIIYSRDGPVGIITLNRPETMNALTATTHRELAQAIGEAAKDDSVRVIILTGAGKAFCSGDDVKALFLSGEEHKVTKRSARLRMLHGENMATSGRWGGHSLMEINKPSIAAVNGAAVGYGCGLALMCSMRVASEKARFGEVFLKVGLMPDEGLIILPRLVGLGKAYEMLLTADIIDGREAERIGLVNKLVPHEDLMNETMELAHRIANKPPIAVELTMKGIHKGLNLNMEEFMFFHGLAFSYCFETEDHMEGARAFAEKREPVFKGK